MMSRDVDIAALREKISTAVIQEEAEELRRLAVGKDVLEIGAYLGYSTILLASVARHLTSVDWHRMEGTVRGGFFPIYLENLERHGLIDDVTMIVAPSDRALPLLRLRSFDLIFIDGGHEYEQVRRDIEYSLFLLKPGGSLAIHDYGPVHVGVTQAVDEAFEPWQVALTMSLAVVTP